MPNTFSDLLSPYRPALEAIVGPAATLRENLPGPFRGNATPLAAVDEKILAIMDLMDADTPNIESVEVALEDLRTTIYAALPADAKELVDPLYLGSTTVVPGVSITFSFGSWGSGPYFSGAGTFGGFRGACRAALGLPAGAFVRSLV
jgi:hypothetical protein